MATAAFAMALLQIIGVNVVLSGDNAVVIALAARSLPQQQQKAAIVWGSGAAVVMRILLTILAVELLRLPYLKLVGSGLLLWIAVKLLVPEHEEEGGGPASTTLASAIKTILIADLVMSLDNVIAVAAAAKGSLILLILGLGISIPLVIFGSALLLKLMERWPVIITIGAALLGWVAGEMAVTDPSIAESVEATAHYLHCCQGAGACRTRRRRVSADCAHRPSGPCPAGFLREAAAARRRVGYGRARRRIRDRATKSPDRSRRAGHPSHERAAARLRRRCKLRVERNAAGISPRAKHGRARKGTAASRQRWCEVCRAHARGQAVGLHQRIRQREWL
jgi:YjbE family integral membrane protein